MIHLMLLAAGLGVEARPFPEAPRPDPRPPDREPPTVGMSAIIATEGEQVPGERPGMIASRELVASMHDRDLPIHDDDGTPRFIARVRVSALGDGRLQAVATVSEVVEAREATRRLGAPVLGLSMQGAASTAAPGPRRQDPSRAPVVDVAADVERQRLAAEKRARKNAARAGRGL